MIPRLAAWCFRRRWLALLLWIVLAISIVIVGKAAKGNYRADYSAPGSDSKVALDILKAGQDSHSGDSFDVVYRLPSNPADVPAFRSQLAAFENQIKTVSVPGLKVPGESSGNGIISITPNTKSQDGTVGIDTVQTKFDSNDPPIKLGKKVDQLRTTAAKTLPAGSAIELSGQIPATGEQKQVKSEFFGFIAAIIILFIAFGSVFAMGIPIGSAIVSLTVATALIGLLEHPISVPNWAPIIASLIGIGVGIDYTLFIIARYKSGLHNGLKPREAVISAYNTAGRAVLFAGVTVVIALAGLTVMKLGYLYGVAASASTAVLVVMVSAMTLVPAILGFVGYKIDGFRATPESVAAAGETSDPVFWRAWSHVIQRHPWRAVVGGVIVLVLLTLPVFNLHLGFADDGSAPKAYTVRRAFDIEKNALGPGSGAKIFVVTELNGPKNQAQLDKLSAAVRQATGIKSASPAQMSPDGKTAIIFAEPTTSPQDKATENAIKNLRKTTIPAAIEGTSLKVHVGGLTAGFIDSSRYIADRLFLFIGAIVILSFLLLMAVFRSVFVPLKAAIMNLLSISAAYGVMSYAVNGSWLGHLIGIKNAIPVPSFVPMIMFAILFGLSMDYEVFLLSRIREEFLRTGDNKTAVADGLAHTARVITAAAAIMVCVFGAFMLDPNTFVKAIGLGLATAILVDASIIRLLLVPATMELLGDWNWWFPKWLDRIVPHFHIDSADVVDLIGDGSVEKEPVLSGSPS